MTTPGPWAVSPTKHRTLIVSAQGFHVTALEEASPEDAALMASAPALLDALQWALGQIDDDLDPDHQAALAAAHQALAHARQGQQTNEV